MELKILGPLTAEHNGTSIVPTAGKPRELLTLLAVYAGHVLPVSTLMEELWGADMPRSAATTLQTYILQLRRRISAAYGPEHPDAAREVLVTRHCGYSLCVAPDAVDVHVYDKLVTAGRRALDAGDDAQASRLYRQALDLWRGTRPMVDVKVGPILEIELARLEESRLGVLERRVEAELRMGLHSELLTELTELVARNPLHEGLHAQSMTALYRAGRPGEALEMYRRLRCRLVEELGLEPMPRLRRLQQAVLSADPALDAEFSR